MPEDLLRKQLRRLISAGNSRKAAEHLCAFLGGESSEYYSDALLLLSRVNRLEYQISEGQLDSIQSDFEKAQINKELLALADQILHRGKGGSPAQAPAHRRKKAFRVKRKISRTPVIGLLLLLFTALLTYFTYRLGFPAPFDLTVRVSTLDEEVSRPLQAERVKIVLDDYHLQPRMLNEQGEAVFPEIPSEYEGATVQLIAIDSRYGVRSQSAQRPSDSKQIAFDLFPLADTTFLRGTVFSPSGRRAPFAWLNFSNGSAYGFTNEEGRFQIGVPRKAGEQVRLQIEWKGIERYNQRIELPEAEPIILNLQ